MSSSFLQRVTKKDIFDDENVATKTSLEQVKVERSVLKNLLEFEEFLDIEPTLILRKKDHVEYLRRGIENLSSRYQCLDASRPWLCYWIVHALNLLNEEIDTELKSRIAQFLSKCQNSEGGFGGGPGQMSHLAPTYAAVNCLCELATKEAYDVIDREKLLSFLLRMRQGDGSFTMHDGGECDTRSVYCALSVASITGILEGCADSLFENTVQWVVSCQTYEGGIAGYPGTEAHGGYTFCGYAALVILGHAKVLDTDRLLMWVANRQMRVEGGFQGRTNKLVDGCYSFWQGGIFPLLHSTLTDEVENYDGEWLFDQNALQEYILLNAQSRFGGLVDKPGKSADYYHTCYTLSGLSLAQHSCDDTINVLGDTNNKINSTHPVFNITWEAEEKARKYFKEQIKQS